MLRFDDVTVRFGALTAVERVSLRAEQGERIALLGPSGAGKSTLLRLAAGLQHPDAGVVTVLDINRAGLSDAQRRQLARRVAVIHQSLDLVSTLKVVHNVNAGRLGSWSTARALRSLVRPLEVDAVRALLAPLGLDDRVFERTDSLSGGQQQRVAVARALRQQGELVLADEPISSVDPVWRRRVLDVVIADCTARNATLVASLHDTDVALERFTRIVGLRAGTVVFDCPAEAVDRAVLLELYGAGAH